MPRFRQFFSRMCRRDVYLCMLHFQARSRQSACSDDQLITVGGHKGTFFQKKKSANNAVQIYCVLICRPHVSAGVLLLRETIVPHTTGIIHLPCPPHSIPKALTVATLSITLLWKNRAFQMFVSSGLWVKLIEGFWAQTSSGLTLD